MYIYIIYIIYNDRMYQHKWGFNHHSVQKYGDANHQSQAEESGDSIVIPSKIEK